MNYIEELDFETAWRKTQRDYNYYMNSFVSTPDVINIYERNTNEWFDNIKTKLDEGEYSPRFSRVVDVPKSDYHLRPATVLHPEDLLVYSSYILYAYDKLKDSLSWSAGNRRFSHILPDDPTESNQWFEFERDYWIEMQETKIENTFDYDYVVKADVAGYYDNIDIERLISIFKQKTENTTLAHDLWDLLGPLAEPRKRGIPQGYGASDILAEIYLDGIDKRLRNYGFDHVRYNDDYVVFASSKDEAIEAQNLLEREFRSRGLNIKSGKTDIIDSEIARGKYMQPESTFRKLKRELYSDGEGSSSSEGDARTDEYYTKADVREILSEIIPEYVDATPSTRYIGDGGVSDPKESNDDIDPDVLIAAYNKHVEGTDYQELEDHLFRFIINRMGNHDIESGTGYCLGYISEGAPDVRQIIYKYFDDLSNPSEVVDKLAELIASDDIRYRFHEFVIIRWFHERGFKPDSVLHAARSILRREDSLPEARDYAVSILGTHGDYSDLELLESKYTEELRSQSKAVFVYAMRDMERNHRNKMYQRVNSDKYLISRAIEAAKQDGS